MERVLKRFGGFGLGSGEKRGGFPARRETVDGQRTANKTHHIHITTAGRDRTIRGRDDRASSVSSEAEAMRQKEEGGKHIAEAQRTL